MAATLLMLDCVDVHAVAGLKFYALAGYAGGSWPTFAPEVAAYPALAKANRVLSYAVNVTEDAELADCETGDLTVAQVRDIWLPRQFGRKVWRPGVYANLSRWRDEGLQDALAHYGSQIRRIVADWTYVEGPVLSGFDCQQFSDHYANRNVDGNSCLPSFFAPTAQPPHVNHPHYDWFSDGLFPTHKWGHLNERKTVEHYDQLRLHPDKHVIELHVSKAHLRWLAERDLFEAKHGSPHANHRPSWDVDHRGWRYQQLIRRAHGQRFV